MKTAAIFDVDNTLIDGSAATYFGKHLFSKGIANPIMLIRLLWYTIEFKLGILNVREAMEKNAFFTGGHTPERYRKEAKEAFERLMKFKIYKETRDIIKEHRKEGLVIILASSGLKYIVEPLGKFFKTDFLCGTEMEIKDGLVTGIPLDPIPYGVGKKTAVELLCKKETIDLANSYFYTDSNVDMPLMEAVKYPVATNPNKKLLKIAKKRNWKILNCTGFIDPDKESK